jgi:hypothetical protein
MFPAALAPLPEGPRRPSPCSCYRLRTTRPEDLLTWAPRAKLPPSGRGLRHVLVFPLDYRPAARHAPPPDLRPSHSEARAPLSTLATLEQGRAPQPPPLPPRSRGARNSLTLKQRAAGQSPISHRPPSPRWQCSQLLPRADPSTLSRSPQTRCRPWFRRAAAVTAQLAAAVSCGRGARSIRFGKNFPSGK